MRPSDPPLPPAAVTLPTPLNERLQKAAQTGRVRCSGGHGPRGSAGCQELDRSPLDIGEPELPGSSQGLAEEFPGPRGLSGSPAGEEHAGPFEAGAGQPGGRSQSLMGSVRGFEMTTGLVEAAFDGGEEPEVVVDGPGGEASRRGHQSPVGMELAVED